MQEYIRKKFLEMISDRITMLLLLIGALELMLYRSVMYTGFESKLEPHILPATSTLLLQDLIGTRGPFAIFASYYYVYGHIFSLILLGAVIFFSKNQKTNLFALVLCFATESLIYFLFPLAPPVRTRAAVPIRVLIFPTSETLISIKYSAFPSGHIIKSALGYLTIIVAFVGFKIAYYIDNNYWNEDKESIFQ